MCEILARNFHLQAAHSLGSLIQAPNFAMMVLRNLASAPRSDSHGRVPPFRCVIAGWFQGKSQSKMDDDLGGLTYFRKPPYRTEDIEDVCYTI